MREQKYGIEEYLKEYEEILNQKPQVETGKQKPNLLEQLKSKTGLNRIGNERT